MNHKKLSKIKNPWKKECQHGSGNDKHDNLKNNSLVTYFPTHSTLSKTPPDFQVKEEGKFDAKWRANMLKKEEEKERFGSDANEFFQSEIERFIEVSKYFSNPINKSASYICEKHLVTYPKRVRLEYQRGGVTTESIKFCNTTLEAVYLKLYKLIPDLEQIKYINLTLSRCKRIPPGLSYNLGLLYDDMNEKQPLNAKIIFVASRKTTTPCYQVCEIELDIDTQKTRLTTN